MDLYEREEKNPYVDAWWKWWPEMRNTLNILRVTGGEPLMHRSTWKLFESIKADPMPHLELNINSNLGFKSGLVDKMIDLVKNEIKTGKIRGDITEFISKAFSEFYYTLYLQRSSWEPKIKKIKIN